MHIEPGVVEGAELALAYGTAAAAAGYSFKLAADDLKTHRAPSLAVRTVLATVSTFFFFEVTPHFAVGLSEVHLILGTTLFLLLGPAAAAFGLVFGLLIQGTFLAASDLPMVFVNLTTLLVPLLAVHALAGRIVPQATAFVDLNHGQVLRLSAVYQGGVVAWVAFWAIYGQGFGAENIKGVLAFGGVYLMVILTAPLADLAVLAAAKGMRGWKTDGLFAQRPFNAA